MTRTEYYRNETAPAAVALLPAAFAVTRNALGQVLLVRRRDDGYWELPGGRIEIGEPASTAVIREVAEEANVDIKLTAIAGVYSEPAHVLVYPNGQAYQQLAICFHAFATDDRPARPDGQETTAAAWFHPHEIDKLESHAAMKRRINDALSEPDCTHYD